jgi:hypothetical protein
MGVTAQWIADLRCTPAGGQRHLGEESEIADLRFQENPSIAGGAYIAFYVCAMTGLKQEWGAQMKSDVRATRGPALLELRHDGVRGVFRRRRIGISLGQRRQRSAKGPFQALHAIVNPRYG